MKRVFLSLPVLLAMAPWAAQSQSQSSAPASQTSPAQTPPAPGGKSAKVWTNDDVGALRTNVTVSVDASFFLKIKPKARRTLIFLDFRPKMRQGPGIYTQALNQ